MAPWLPCCACQIAVLAPDLPILCTVEGKVEVLEVSYNRAAGQHGCRGSAARVPTRPWASLGGHSLVYVPRAQPRVKFAAHLVKSNTPILEATNTRVHMLRRYGTFSLARLSNPFVMAQFESLE